jgi:hypothetical protein
LFQIGRSIRVNITIGIKKCLSRLGAVPSSLTFENWAQNVYADEEKEKEEEIVLPLQVKERKRAE